MSDGGITTGWRPLAAGLVPGLLTWAVVVAMFAAMGFDVLRSDVAEYALWSHAWWYVESLTHIPGYPMVAWAFRLLTLGWLGDAALLQGVALLSWAASVGAVDRILSRIGPEARPLGTVIYALFPFVGITYAAYPVSDSTAAAALALGVWALLAGNGRAFAACMALGLLVHKAAWPTWGLLSLVAVTQRRVPVAAVAAGVLPILAWYAFGYRTLSGLWWLEDHVNEHLTYRSGLPVLDGLLGPLVTGGPAKYAKMLVTWIGFGVAAALTAWSVRRREWLLAAIAFPTVLWMLLLNEWVIWAAVRHEKLVVLPLAAWFCSDPSRAPLARDVRVLAVVTLGLVATQIAFAWYVAVGYGWD